MSALSTNGFMTYIQSIRRSLSLRFPGGVRRFKKASTNATATPEIGKFKSWASCRQMMINIPEWTRDLQNSQRHWPFFASSPPTRGPIPPANAHILDM